MQAAGGAFGILFRGGAGGAVDSVIPSLLAGLAGPEPGQALAGLRVILGVRPGALGSMLPRLLKPPLTRSDITALGSLSEVAGQHGQLPPPYLSQIHIYLPTDSFCRLYVSPAICTSSYTRAREGNNRSHIHAVLVAS